MRRMRETQNRREATKSRLTLLVSGPGPPWHTLPTYLSAPDRLGRGPGLLSGCVCACVTLSCSWSSDDVHRNNCLAFVSGSNPAMEGNLSLCGKPKVPELSLAVVGQLPALCAKLASMGGPTSSKHSRRRPGAAESLGRGKTSYQGKSSVGSKMYVKWKCAMKDCRLGGRKVSPPDITGLKVAAR